MLNNVGRFPRCFAGNPGGHHVTRRDSKSVEMSTSKYSKVVLQSKNLFHACSFGQGPSRLCHGGTGGAAACGAAYGSPTPGGGAHRSEGHGTDGTDGWGRHGSHRHVGDTQGVWSGVFLLFSCKFFNQKFMEIYGNCVLNCFHIFFLMNFCSSYLVDPVYQIDCTVSRPDVRSPTLALSEGRDVFVGKMLDTSIIFFIILFKNALEAE